jgi:hypothetical protein
VDGVGPPSDFTGLSRRKWYFMAAGWSLLLLVPAIVALTSDAPVWLRLLQLLAVLGYAACYVFGLYEGIRRGSRAFTAAVLVVMAALCPAGGARWARSRPRRAPCCACGC